MSSLFNCIVQKSVDISKRKKYQKVRFIFLKKERVVTEMPIKDVCLYDWRDRDGISKN